MDLELQDAATATPTLVGHSGARITCFPGAGRLVVRKMAGQAAQNPRLRRQCRKQVHFAGAGVDTPPVLGWGEQDGLGFFDMEYVPASSIATRLCLGESPDIGTVARFVADWVQARRREADGMLAAGMLAEKLEAVLRASAANVHLGVAAARLPALAARLRRLRFPSLPHSPCHGDFTTENMLAAGAGRVVLIDFDDTGLESYCLDIAKLYQDLLGLWCLRRIDGVAAGGVQGRRAVAAVGRLRQAIDATLPETLAELAPDLPALVCLNLMRALPYSRSEADCRFILDRVEAVLRQSRLAE